MMRIRPGQKCVQRSITCCCSKGGTCAWYSPTFQHSMYWIEFFRSTENNRHLESYLQTGSFSCHLQWKVHCNTASYTSLKIVWAMIQACITSQLLFHSMIMYCIFNNYSSSPNGLWVNSLREVIHHTSSTASSHFWTSWKHSSPKALSCTFPSSESCPVMKQW